MKEPLQKISAAIFDLDDTLYRHRTFVEGAYRAVVHAFEKITGRSDSQFYNEILALYDQRGEKDRRIFSDALKKRGLYSEELEWALVTAYRAYRPEKLTMFDGVVERLAALKEHGMKIGLLTNGQSGTQRGKIAALGAERYFDAIVISGEFDQEIAKPDKRIFEHALKKMGSLPCEVAMIGNDPETDIAGALLTGIFPIFVRQGFYKNAALPGGAIDFFSTNEAIDFILRCIIEKKKLLS
jgi:putative hydrolase of the HAD superfamily